MCGIIGYVGSKPVVPVLVEGLRRLEYRGYDSAGIAVVRDGAIALRRAAGKLSNLELALADAPLDGDYGIGHTRWATHGRPTEENAHPHRDCTGRIVVIHNGIIENHLELKRELAAEGHRFVTETDTEVVAHVVEREMRGDGLEGAVRRALGVLRGLFALVFISADDPRTIVAVRNGPPLVVGLGDGEYFVASDVPAVLAHTRDVVFLDDRDLVVVTPEGAVFEDERGRRIEKTAQHITWDPVLAEKAGYKHFMLKEIFEQPWAVRETTLGRLSEEAGRVFLDEVAISSEALRAVDRVVMLACGTSWHAALVGKFLIERFAGLPVEVDYGSEFRYRTPILGERTLAVAITQSGETADTLAALREARRRGAKTVAVCNVVGSMATRESDGTVYTHAGPEIGVASTKAFTSQLVALHLLAVYLGQERGALAPADARPHLAALAGLPILLERALQSDAAIDEIAGRFYQRSDFLYLGRGINYPIALVTEGDDRVAAALDPARDMIIAVPDSDPLLTPVVLTVPLQLLAYHVAVRRGCDVDQPRNLAKSVTVE